MDRKKLKPQRKKLNDDKKVHTRHLLSSRTSRLRAKPAYTPKERAEGEPWIGRVSFYVNDPDRYDEQMYRLRLLGLPVAKIAKVLGIGLNTMYEWIAKYPSFREAFLLGGTEADSKVADAMFQAAIGYEHPETKVFYDSKTGEIVTHEITKKYPPSVQAATTWLTNRQPERWKNRSNAELTGKDGAPLVPPMPTSIIIQGIKPGDVTPEELANMDD